MIYKTCDKLRQINNASKSMVTLSPHLLVVEDDLIWQHAVERTMANQGWFVSCSSDLRASEKILKNEKIDLCLVDLNLDHAGHGFDLVNFISRHAPHTQSIILSGIDDDEEKIKGLKLGAIDYLTKPISLKELALRLDRLINHLSPNAAVKVCENSICFKNFRFNKSTYELFYQERAIHLTDNEKLLLFYFLTVPQGKLKREVISEKILKKTLHPADRAVDMLISHLRQKFSFLTQQVVIKSLRGVGYQLFIN